MDPTCGVLSSLVSAAVNPLLELGKSAIHCKKKRKDLEDLLDQASRFMVGFKLKGFQAWRNSIQAKIEEGRSHVLQCQSTHFLNIPSRIKIARKIDECSKRIREHLEEGKQNVELAALHKKPSTSTTDVVPKEEQHFVPPEDKVFGMEKTLEEVLSNLLSMESNNKWVGVYGAGGAGKTLLAKRVSKNSRVRSHFDQVLWLTFGKSWQVEAKQNELAQQINFSLSSGERISNETLERELDGKRCLLILDDVWEAGRNLDLFDVVQQANGSKIFITTRISHVLDRKGATKTYLGLLGKEDSMKLFMLHAFPKAQNQISEVQEEVKQVVSKCGGLPLVLKVIGSRMAGRQDWDYVLELLNDKQLASLDNEDQQVMQRLKLGYDALALHRNPVQQHFLYFAAYPEDYLISFWELFKCWKGEGLVNNTAHAISVLKTLENYALISTENREVYSELYADKFYRIHDALLALALHILDRDGPKCYFKAGQKVPACLEDACRNDFKRISLVSCEMTELQTSEKNKATTYLLLDHNKITALPSLSNFESLKVLCLRCSSLESLPDSIGELRNLETLDLGGNFSLERIPDSLEMLTKLSYLDVRACPKLQEFPVDALLKFSNLVFFDGQQFPVHAFLKVLDLFLCDGKQFIESDIWKCKRSHEKCLGSKNGQLDLDVMFQALTNLVVLRLWTGSLNVEIPESISKLSQLKELSILYARNIHIHGNFQMTNLEILSLQNVQNLPLDWDWSKFPKLVSLDFRLKGDDDIKVTRMKNLKLFKGPFNDLSCLTQQNFPKLEELTLWKCPKLIQAHIQLASLKVVDFMGCDSITNLSISLLPNLELLTVQRCNGVNVIDISECPSLLHFTLDGKFPQLHALRLCCNESLSNVTLGVERLPLLQELDLYGCKKLKTLPSGDSEDSSFYSSLRFLDLEGTSISKAQLSQRLGLICSTSENKYR